MKPTITDNVIARAAEVFLRQERSLIRTRFQIGAMIEELAEALKIEGKRKTGYIQDACLILTTRIPKRLKGTYGLKYFREYSVSWYRKCLTWHRAFTNVQKETICSLRMTEAYLERVLLRAKGAERNRKLKMLDAVQPKHILRDPRAKTRRKGTDVPAGISIVFSPPFEREALERCFACLMTRCRPELVVAAFEAVAARMQQRKSA